MNISKELLEKAKQTKTPEELLLLAKENGVELSEKDAAECFSRIRSTGELSDIELNNVTGGVLTSGRSGDDEHPYDWPC